MQAMAIMGLGPELQNAEETVAWLGLVLLLGESALEYDSVVRLGFRVLPPSRGIRDLGILCWAKG